MVRCPDCRKPAKAGHFCNKCGHYVPRAMQEIPWGSISPAYSVIAITVGGLVFFVFWATFTDLHGIAFHSLPTLLSFAFTAVAIASLRCLNIAKRLQHRRH